MLRTKPLARHQLGSKQRGELSQSELIVLIIVAVSFAVVLIVLGVVFKNYSKVDSLTCGAQVREANVRNRLMGREEAMNITACQTKYITISRSELPEDRTKADLAVKKRIADTMITCWKNWGEGELDLFNGEGDYCSPCADIQFDEELQRFYRGETQTEGTLSGLSEYMQTKKVPGTNSALSYEQVLTGKKVVDHDLVETARAPKVQDLPVEKGFSILYSHQKKRTDDTFIRKISDATGYDITPQKLAIATGGTVSTGITVIGTYFSGGKLWRLSTVVGAKVGAVAGVTAYVYARESEEFTVTSATYITPLDANNIYVKACNEVANPLRSP